MTTALVQDLAQAIGSDNVRFDHMTRLLYSTDASNYQVMPIGVTFPRDADDVAAIHQIAAQHQAPILPRGGGSSLAGQTVNHAVVMDFSRYMRRVRGINAEAQSVLVEPGVVLGTLNRQVAPLGLMYGPDPASAERATIGGCIGNNSTGAHSILYGMTADNILRLEVVLPEGERVWLDADHPRLRDIRAQVGELRRRHTAEIERRYPKTFRTVAGYALNRIDAADVNLNWLLAGSEGTLATIVQAELKLVPRPPASQKRLAMLHFDSLRASLEATPRIMELQPSAVELMDQMLIRLTRLSPEYSQKLTFVEGDPAAVLIVEFYGESEAALEHHIQRLSKLLAGMGHRGAMTQALSPAEQQNVWSVRAVGLGLLMSERRPDKPLPFIEDAAVPVEHLADYISDVEAIIHNAGTSYAIYAHASAGCLHVRPLINLKSAEGLRQYREIGAAVAQKVVQYQGSITGEHGKGRARSEFEAQLFGEELIGAFRAIKGAFDPRNAMNPGNIIDPPPMDRSDQLRYSPAYEVIPVKTRYDWSADGGLNGATEMCNGAGVCRKEGTGTMCPSYMATLDEAHATRGRANALRLAMSGHLKAEGDLASDSVREVFDLCLSCKACRAECPSSVDVARMKAEFMASYHDAQGVPLSTRLFANIHRLNALGSRLPQVANFLLGSAFGKVGARLVGLPTERPLPRLAARPFSQSQPQAQPANPHATLVVDTFTEFNHPALGDAFLHICQRLGLQVSLLRLPAQGCCGRPAISKGLLDMAKQMATRNVDSLHRHLDSAPFIFLEPSCLSAFVDDYPGLVDAPLQMEAAEVASRCISAERWLLQEFEARAEALTWHQAPEAQEILLHGHCHQKALWGTADSLALLRLIPGVNVREIDSGCCGVAGSFGYEHYALSMKIGEQRLLPAIRNTPEAWVAAPGTSCRAQIHDAGLKAAHPVEWLAQALG